MEINHFDKDGKKIESNENNFNDNNPKIINNSRLANIPVTRLSIDPISEGKKEEQKIFSNKSEELTIQTSIKKEKSKYEVDENTKFKIEFGVMFDDGQIMIIPKDKFDAIDKFGDGIYEKHWVLFRMWNFLESVGWRQECMDFLQTYRIFNLNTNKFNELKVRRLLLDWSFKDYGDNHRLFHMHKQLTDESMNLFFKDFNPMIIHHIINEMNKCLGE